MEACYMRGMETRREVQLHHRQWSGQEYHGKQRQLKLRIDFVGEIKQPLEASRKMERAFLDGSVPAIFFSTVQQGRCQ